MALPTLQKSASQPCCGRWALHFSCFSESNRSPCFPHASLLLYIVVLVGLRPDKLPTTKHKPAMYRFAWPTRQEDPQTRARVRKNRAQNRLAIRDNCPGHTLETHGTCSRPVFVRKLAKTRWLTKLLQQKNCILT